MPTGPVNTVPPEPGEVSGRTELPAVIDALIDDDDQAVLEDLAEGDDEEATEADEPDDEPAADIPTENDEPLIIDPAVEIT